MTPDDPGNIIPYCSSKQLPHRSFRSLRFFRADMAPFKGPQLASCNASRATEDTVRCAVLGAEVPGHRQQQLTQTLIVRLLKTHFFTPVLECEKSTK